MFCAKNSSHCDLEIFITLTPCKFYDYQLKMDVKKMMGEVLVCDIYGANNT